MNGRLKNDPVERSDVRLRNVPREFIKDGKLKIFLKQVTIFHETLCGHFTGLAARRH